MIQRVILAPRVTIKLTALDFRSVAHYNLPIELYQDRQELSMQT